MINISQLVNESGYAHGDDALTLPMKHAIRYACPVCKKTYLRWENARSCRDRPYECGLAIGDIVIVPGHYHISQLPNDPWIAFEAHIPFFVVTAIHPDPNNAHRAVVTLTTLAEGKLCCNWSPATGEGHHAIFRITPERTAFVKGKIPNYWEDRYGKQIDTCEPPEIVKQQAAELAAIGISSPNLL